MRDKIQILCYGDSNTWGPIARYYDAGIPAPRYDAQTRWPRVMQAQLGDGFEVCEDGLGGRSTIYTREGLEWKSGELYLLPCMRAHSPLDLVVVMLGTNDLQINQEITEADLPVGISRIADLVLGDSFSGRDVKPPKLLIIAPPEIRPSAPEGRTEVYAKFRCDIGRSLSLKFPEVYAKVAQEKGCYFLNGQDYIQPCPADGVHIDGESHIRLGTAAAAFIREHIFPSDGSC